MLGKRPLTWETQLWVVQSVFNVVTIALHTYTCIDWCIFHTRCILKWWPQSWWCVSSVHLHRWSPWLTRRVQAEKTTLWRNDTDTTSCRKPYQCFCIYGFHNFRTIALVVWFDMLFCCWASFPSLACAPNAAVRPNVNEPFQDKTRL